MIDLGYRTVQSILNKNHYGNLIPQKFNEFANMAILKLHNDLFNRYRKAVNSFRAGRGGMEYVDYQEDIEFFTTEIPTTKSAGVFPLPADKNNVTAIWYTNGQELVEVAKSTVAEIGYTTGHSAPSLTYPVYRIVGNSAKILPDSISQVDIYYVRTPAVPKWTYTEISGVPVYNPSAGDHQDLDMPVDWLDDFVEEVVRLGSLHLRETMTAQASDSESTKQYQKDTL